MVTEFGPVTGRFQPSQTVLEADMSGAHFVFQFIPVQVSKN